MTDPNDPYAAPDGGEHPQQQPTRPVPPMTPESSATPSAPPAYPGPAADPYATPGASTPGPAYSPYAAPQRYGDLQPYVDPRTFGPPAGQPATGWPYPVRRTNGLAVASLVLGILWLYWVGSVLALIFGYLAMSQIKNAPADAPQDGRGLAVAGVVLGWVGIATLVLVMLFFVGVALAPVGL